MKEKPYQICNKTVMDTNTDPNIIFDKNGISNYFWNFERQVKPHWETGVTGRKKLNSKIKKIKKDGRNRDFDCILGLSGGLDSSFMLHVIVKDFGLRPLVFHVDGGWNSEQAVSNIYNMVNKLNLDLFTEVINWQEMKNFQLAMFKSGVPHLDVPQDMAFIGVLYKYAEKHRIEYILNGGNISTECVPIPLDILYWGTDMIHIKDILKKFGTIPMATFPFSSIYYHKIYLKLVKGIKVLKPLNFMNYVKKDAIATLQSEYNWKNYSNKHYESRFTRFFEGWWLPTRFNFDMRRREYSSLILTNQMKRNEALEYLQKPAFDYETAQKEFSYIADKLEISEDELLKYLHAEKMFYWNYANQKKIFDLGELIMNTCFKTVRGGAY